MRRKLIEVEGIIQFGYWMQRKGFRVGEGPGPFGPVTPGAHVPTSLHYQGLAYDVNFGVTGPEEHEQLVLLYNRILRFKRTHPKFPLDEMFHDGLGFIKELGTEVNHPISDHNDHLHVGFSQDRWTLG